MSSFPSWWIIEPEESASTPRAQSSRPASPLRALRYSSLCRAQGSCSPSDHDDIFPPHLRTGSSHDDAYPLLFRRPGPSSQLSHGAVSANSCPSTSVLGQVLAPPMSTALPHSAAALPHSEPIGRYSTDFPSSWIESPERTSKSPADATNKSALGVGTFSSSASVKSNPSQAPMSLMPTVSPFMPIHSSQLPFRTGPTVEEPEEEMLKNKRDPIHELLGALKEPETDGPGMHFNSLWISPCRPVICAVDQRLCPLGEKHPSSFDDNLSDTSGLGDSPHVHNELYDMYSLYSTSTYGTYLKNRAAAGTNPGVLPYGATGN